MPFVDSPWRTSRPRLPRLDIADPVALIEWAVTTGRISASEVDEWVERLTSGYVESIRARWYPAGGYYPTAYTVEESQDGRVWRALVSRAGVVSADGDLVDVFPTRSIARYFRIRTTDYRVQWSADAALALRELDLNAGIPVASASSIYNAQTPDLALDGNGGTWWQPLRIDGPPFTFTVDRGAGAEFVELLTVTAQWYPTGGVMWDGISDHYRPIDYRIEVSDDGASWTTARTVTGNDADLVTDDLDASGRYFRYVVTHCETFAEAVARGLNPPGGMFAFLALIDVTWTEDRPTLVASSPNPTFGAQTPAKAVDGDLNTWWQPVNRTHFPGEGVTFNTFTWDLTTIPYGDPRALLHPSGAPYSPALPGAGKTSGGWFHDGDPFTDPGGLAASAVFQADYEGMLHIYTIDPDGGHVRRMTTFVTDSRGTSSVAVDTSMEAGCWIHFPIQMRAGDTLAIKSIRTAGGANVLWNGIFLDQAVRPLGYRLGTADVEGRWVGVYGADGYVLCNWSEGILPEDTRPPWGIVDLSRLNASSLTLQVDRGATPGREAWIDELVNRRGSGRDHTDSASLVTSSPSSAVDPHWTAS